MEKPNQRKKKTYAEWLQEVVNDYIAANEPWPADTRTIAAWAVANNRWEASRPSQIDLCAKDLARAMRAETEVDPQGRSVRAKHCATITAADEEGKLVQKTMWFGRSATPDLMHRSFQQRRKGILGDCKHLKIDQDSYNDNNDYGATLQMSFDFSQDLEDLEHDTEYNPTPPPSDE